MVATRSRRYFRLSAAGKKKDKLKNLVMVVVTELGNMAHVLGFRNSTEIPNLCSISVLLIQANTTQCLASIMSSEKQCNVLKKGKDWPQSGTRLSNVINTVMIAADERPRS